MECYIDFLDCKNNFKETRKEFKNYAAARHWGIDNFENFNIDMIKFF